MTRLFKLAELLKANINKDFQSASNKLSKIVKNLPKSSRSKNIKFKV